MTYLGATTVSDKSVAKLDDISSSFDGVSVNFTLRINGTEVFPGSSVSVNISLDGVWQEPLSAYSINGSTITFDTPPRAGVKFFGAATYYGGSASAVSPDAVNTTQLVNSAVTTNKLADGAVTAAKLSSLTYLIETANVINSAPPLQANIDVKNNSFVYYTGNNPGTITINVRGDSSTTLNSMLANGQILTSVVALTNGSTGYGVNIRVDNVTQTPRWLGNVAPTGGNSNSIDLYNISVLKTDVNTYTVLASQSQFGIG